MAKPHLAQNKDNDILSPIYLTREAKKWLT